MYMLGSLIDIRVVVLLLPHLLHGPWTVSNSCRPPTDTIRCWDLGGLSVRRHRNEQVWPVLYSWAAHHAGLQYGSSVNLHIQSNNAALSTIFQLLHLRRRIRWHSNSHTTRSYCSGRPLSAGSRHVRQLRLQIYREHHRCRDRRRDFPECA